MYLDVLCLQEYNLQDKKLVKLGGVVWKNTLLVGNSIFLGFNHKPSLDVRTSHGGTLIFVSLRIYHLVKCSRVVDANVQLVILRDIPRRDLGIINVYNPKSLVEHINL